MLPAVTAAKPACALQQEGYMSKNRANHTGWYSDQITLVVLMPRSQYFRKKIRARGIFDNVPVLLHNAPGLFQYAFLFYEYGPAFLLFAPSRFVILRVLFDNAPLLFDDAPLLFDDAPAVLKEQQSVIEDPPSADFLAKKKLFACPTNDCNAYSHCFDVWPFDCNAQAGYAGVTTAILSRSDMMGCYHVPTGRYYYCGYSFLPTSCP